MLHNYTTVHTTRHIAFSWKSDNDNGKYYKYVCITTNRPDTKSNPNRNRN